jgi:hypothetical protein
MDKKRVVNLKWNSMKKIWIIIFTLLVGICFSQEEMESVSTPQSSKNMYDILSDYNFQLETLNKEIVLSEAEYASSPTPINMSMLLSRKAKREIFAIYLSKILKRMENLNLDNFIAFAGIKSDILDKQRELESNYDIVINYKIDPASEKEVGGLGFKFLKMFAKNEVSSINRTIDVNIKAYKDANGAINLDYATLFASLLQTELSGQPPLEIKSYPLLGGTAPSNSNLLTKQYNEALENYINSLSQSSGGGSINSACFFDVSDKYLYAPNGYLFKAPTGSRLAYIESSYMVEGFTYGINVDNKNYFADIPLVNSGVQGGDQFYGYKTEAGEVLAVTYTASANFGFFAHRSASIIKLYKVSNAVKIGIVNTTDYAIHAGSDIQTLISNPTTLVNTSCNSAILLSVDQIALFNKYKNFTIKSKTYIYEKGQLLTFFPNGKKYIKTFSNTNYTQLKKDLKDDKLSNDEALLIEKTTDGYKVSVNFGSNITVKSGYELNGTAKTKSEKAFEDVMNVYLSNKTNLAANHNQEDSQNFEDGKKLHIKQSNIWDLVISGVTATKEFLQEAEIKPKYWDGTTVATANAYNGNWVNTPPYLTGVGNGFIEEVKDIPVLVTAVTDLAVNKVSRDKLWTSLKGLSVDKIKKGVSQMANQYVSTIQAGGDPAWHSGGKTTVMAVNLVVAGAAILTSGKKMLDNMDDIGGLIKKKADDLLDAFTKLQKEVLEKVRKGEFALNNNFRKGNFGEMNTDVNLVEKNYNAIHTNRVTDIDASMKPGIDGVFEKDGTFYIVETKYGTSRLNKNTNTGPQMSDSWINGSLPGKSTTRLEDAVGELKALEINGVGYQRVLSEVDVNGNVVFKSIDSMGNSGAIINL